MRVKSRVKKSSQSNLSKEVRVLMKNPQAAQEILDLVTRMQKHLDNIIERRDELEAENVMLNAKIKRQAKPPRPDCESCGGEGLDFVNFATGEVFRARCWHC